MSKRLGIDLGTTYSAVSYYDELNRRVETVDLVTAADGERVVRSVVYYPGTGQPAVVGETALNAQRGAPERVLVGIKRSMGTSYRTPPIDGREYTPQEVSSEILKALMHDACMQCGEETRDVVITVPAYFNDNERAATEEAGKLAGLNVLSLLPEPHAAALAYSIEKAVEIQDKHLLVYDLGGGTFDVTLIHATKAGGSGNAINLKVETLCKDGDMHLGGLDWDRALAEIVAEKIQSAHNIDVWQDPQNESILLYNCEKAKRSLSRPGIAGINIIADAAGHQAEVTLAEFEERSHHLLNRTRQRLENVLQEFETQHKIPRSKVQIMLTGGSSKMPMVKRMIESVTGAAPLQHGNPELLVTIGAAYWAHLLDGSAITRQVATPSGQIEEKTIVVSGMKDNMPAVGIEVLRGGKPANSVIVPQGQTGTEYEKVFNTSEDGMTEIEIVLYQGSSPEIEACEKLLVCTLFDLPPGRPRGQPVKVKLGYSDSGILQGHAVDVRSGKEVEIRFDRSGAK